MAEKVERTENKDNDNRKKFYKHKQKRRVCIFCEDRNKQPIDYKDISRLRKLVTEKGKILPRRQTGTCAKHQRELTVAIKRAKNMALLTFKGD
ncbi:MAG: 30S ribosomal protein S18 [Clostridia bacterium]|nr:30S ribosomal protein S18 [Clostridia bacterium]